MIRHLRCLSIVAILAGATPALAQERTRCDLLQQENTRIFTYSVGDNRYNQHAGGGVNIVCPSRGITLRADSADFFGFDQRWVLIGQVNYRDPKLTLLSDVLTYMVPDERIIASGNVRATLPSGSMLIGPHVTYLREVPRLRPRSQMTAIANPTVTIADRDSAGRPGIAATVNAGTIFMDGDSLIYASSQVQISRTDLFARGDSAFIDAGTEFIRLMRGPSVLGRGERPFQLTGDVIDAFSKSRKLERVLARGRGTAKSDSLVITADTIDLRLRADRLQRAIAWSAPGVARATSPSQTIIADSIDVDMPAQRIRRVDAVRHAFAESAPDTLRFRTDERDWLRGDTIVAVFDTMPPAPGDSTRTPDIQRIASASATPDAQAYYHMAPRDSGIRKPAISYVRARRVVIEFRGREVGTVTVEDSVAGIYAEPLRDTTRAARPATTPPPMSGSVPPVPESAPLPRGSTAIRRP